MASHVYDILGHGTAADEAEFILYTTKFGNVILGARTPLVHEEYNRAFGLVN